MLFPKQKTKGHKKLRNPLPTVNDICVICGKGYAQSHEVFFGTKNRTNSILHEMQVRLCYEHHEKAHNDIVFDLALKRQYQRIFEQTHNRECFMKIFGRNYLEDI